MDEFIKNALEEAGAVYQEAFALYKSRKVPVHFVRFEELMRNPKGTLLGLFQFLLDKKDLENTVVERRIDEVIKMGQQVTEVYPIDPSRHFKVDSIKDDKIDESQQYKPSFDSFTPHQVNLIFGKLYDAMVFFGYIRGVKIIDE